MGLDMYLYMRQNHYASKYTECCVLKREFPSELKRFEANGSIERRTDYQVGYWRKANEIHKWFVDNCGGRRDECQDMYVSRENLEDLLHLCKRVLEDHSKAPDLLPTQEGFFFGSTTYDEYYFEDIEHTVDIITNVLEVIDECEAKAHALMTKDPNAVVTAHDLYSYSIIYASSW